MVRSNYIVNDINSFTQTSAHFLFHLIFCLNLTLKILSRNGRGIEFVREPEKMMASGPVILQGHGSAMYISGQIKFDS